MPEIDVQRSVIFTAGRRQRPLVAEVGILSTRTRRHRVFVAAKAAEEWPGKAVSAAFDPFASGQTNMVPGHQRVGPESNDQCSGTQAVSVTLGGRGVLSFVQTNS